MNNTGLEEMACPGATDPVCELYEQLRSYVLETAARPGPVYGLGVMLRQGMRAWIESTLEYNPIKQASDNTISPRHPWVHSSMQAELTIMLAGIVLKHTRKEVA